MKNLVLILFLLLCSAYINAQVSTDNENAGHNSATNQQPPSAVMVSIGVGAIDYTTSNAFGNWLNSNGYNQNKFGIYKSMGDEVFRKNWMFSFEMMDNSIVDPVNISNFTLGAGYKILNFKGVKVYGALNVGCNMVEIYPTTQMAFDAGKTSTTDGSAFVQYSLLASPHILLVKPFDKNLSRVPGHFSTFSIALDLGYQASFFESEWFYGYSNNHPFTASTVTGIPNVNFDAFYALLKVGIYGGKIK